MMLIIICAIGYIFGCIHGSQIIGNYKNINIKKSGSKNAGASNTTMILGWKYGVIVALIDVFKAIFSIFIVSILLNHYGIINEAQIFYIYINAFFVIIGHNYPITMSFNGGKGTASFIGLILMIDWKIAFMGLCILLLLSFATDYFVIGTLSMYVSFIGYTWYVFDFLPVIIACLLFTVFIMKHLENYKRIINKQEVRLSSFLRKQAS